jgi:hypothetical protein
LPICSQPYSLLSQHRYPGFRDYFERAAGETGEQNRILLVQLPGGTLPLAPMGGLAVGDAKARASRALHAFLFKAARAHPELELRDGCCSSCVIDE